MVKRIGAFLQLLVCEHAYKEWEDERSVRDVENNCVQPVGFYSKEE
jgi:DNA-binding transcriptional regulator WhiA